VFFDIVNIYVFFILIDKIRYTKYDTVLELHFFLDGESKRDFNNRALWIGAKNKSKETSP